MNRRNKCKRNKSVKIGEKSKKEITMNQRQNKNCMKGNKSN